MSTQTILILIALATLALQYRGTIASAVGASGGSAGSSAGAGAASTDLVGNLSYATVFALAQRTVSTYGFSASPQMLAIIAFVESSGNASVGVHPDGHSIGLMGVTLPVASDNAGRGHHAYPASVDSLMTADGAMYHAAAHVTWLKTWSGQQRADDYVIRAYNAGATGASQGRGQEYLAAFYRRRAELGV